MPGSRPLHRAVVIRPRRAPLAGSRRKHLELKRTEACRRRLRLRRVGRASQGGRSTASSHRARSSQVGQEDQSRASGGVPLGIGGCGSSAAHAADGIVPGRSVCPPRSRSSRPEARRRGRRTRRRPVDRLSSRPEVSQRRFHRACRRVRSSLARHWRQLPSPLAVVLLSEVDRAGFDRGRRGGCSFLCRGARRLSSRRQWPSRRTSSSHRARSCRPPRPLPGCPASRV